jgi:Fe-S cluster biogenesis protein NfuA
MTAAQQARVEARIRMAIDALRPLLPFGDAAVELIAFDGPNGVAVVRVAGDCPECEMPAVALVQGIEAHLRQRVPEIRAVRAEPARRG